jgi:hypothetical protein
MAKFQRILITYQCLNSDTDTEKRILIYSKLKTLPFNLATRHEQET